MLSTCVCGGISTFLIISLSFFLVFLVFQHSCQHWQLLVCKQAFSENIQKLMLQCPLLALFAVIYQLFKITNEAEPFIDSLKTFQNAYLRFVSSKFISNSLSILSTASSEIGNLEEKIKKCTENFTQGFKNWLPLFYRLDRFNIFPTLRDSIYNTKVICNNSVLDHLNKF